MKRMFLTLATLAASLTLSQAALAEKPAGRQAGVIGQAPKPQGFTRSGNQGIGLFGPAGGAGAQRAGNQRSNAQQFSGQQFGAQPFGIPAYQGPSAYSAGYRPQLQYNLQYRLQVPYPSQQYRYIYSYSDDGVSGGWVLMGNPANSFAPAGAYGFGPGAIFGW